LRHALVILLIAALAVIVVPVILVLPVLALCAPAPQRVRPIASPRIRLRRLALFRLVSFRAPPAFV